MKVLDEIDHLSKISIEWAESGTGILSFMHEFAERVTRVLNIERINVWLLNKEKNAIFSIAEYDRRDNSFNHHSWVYERDIPHYFQHLKESKIILAPDIHTHPATYEFSDNYAKEHNVISLMDIPLRLNGELIGVMCFEKTGSEPRVFNEQEQIFAMALAQLAVAHIENTKRLHLQKRLEEALKEKEILIKELNHRVKNNFSVLVSLLRLSKENANKATNEIFDSFEHQVFSMLKVHELLLESENYSIVNLSDYLQKLGKEFISSYSDMSENIQLNIPSSNFEISTKNSIHIGLIVTEIFLNSLKYCIIPKRGIFELSMKLLNNNCAEITIGDSCNNFDFEEALKKSCSSGLGIIKDLAESSGFQVIYPTVQCSKYKIIVSG